MSGQISVVIPCFNYGRYLAEAVDSVLAQTAPAHEIVIVDDGSTDPETHAVLERFQRPRTRLVRQPNGGHPAAANRGLAETTGELLCFLDADDALEPTYFEKALAAFAREPDLAFVSSWVQEF